MAEDLTNLILADTTSQIAEDLVEKFFFPDVISVARFAFSYALLNIEINDDINELDGKYNSQGKHYNVGSVDTDGILVEAVKERFPNCNTPFRYIRYLMNIGLEIIDEKIQSKEINSLSELM